MKSIIILDLDAHCVILIIEREDNMKLDELLKLDKLPEADYTEARCPYCMDEISFEPTSMCCGEVHGELFAYYKVDEGTAEFSMDNEFLQVI